MEICLKTRHLDTSTFSIMRTKTKDQEEELAALAAVAASGGRGIGGVVVQAYPVGLGSSS